MLGSSWPEHKPDSFYSDVFFYHRVLLLNPFMSVSLVFFFFFAFAVVVCTVVIPLCHSEQAQTQEEPRWPTQRYFK